MLDGIEFAASDIDGLTAAALVLAIASLPASAGMVLDELGVEDAGGAAVQPAGGSVRNTVYLPVGL